MKEFIYRNGGAQITLLSSSSNRRYHAYEWTDTTPNIPVGVNYYMYEPYDTNNNIVYFENDNLPTKAFKIVATTDFYCFSSSPDNLPTTARILIPYSESYDSATGYYTKIYEAYPQYQEFVSTNMYGTVVITKQTYITDSNNRKLLDNMPLSSIISIETYQGWLEHDIHNYGLSRIAPITTTANIGIKGTSQYSSSGWQTTYTIDTITQSTPMYYIEKDTTDRVIQLMTHGTDNRIVLIADSTGGDNFTNLTTPTYTRENPDPLLPTQYLWKINVPANKRLLLLELTSSSGSGQIYYYWYKGYNTVEVGLRVIPWENSILHQYTQTGGWSTTGTYGTQNQGWYISVPSAGNDPTSTLTSSSSSQAYRYIERIWAAQPNTKYKIRYTLNTATESIYFGGGSYTSSTFLCGAQIGNTLNIKYMTNVSTKLISSSGSSYVYETEFTTPANTINIIISNLYNRGAVQPQLFETAPGWTND